MKQLYLFCCLLIIIACSKPQEPSTPPQILQFDFEGVKPITTNIDPSTKTITIVVPYQTSLSALIPKISIEDGAGIVPASGITQNFSQAIYYTLSKGGQKVIYTIKVNIANQPQPEIAQVKSDTTEAGFDFEIVGKNFGKFALDIQVFLVDNANTETLLKHQLIDSTQIKLTTNIDQKVGFYQIKLKVKDQQTISSTKIWIAYPAPKLSSILQMNLLLNDTLWLNGKYTDFAKYLFQTKLNNKVNSYFLDFITSKSKQLGFKLSKNIPIGTYSVQLYNSTEKKLSREENFEISVYDSEKPFVREIISPKDSYKVSEKIIFKTINFSKIDARFFQVTLHGVDKTYIQNGIYDATKQTMDITLPEIIKAGIYTIHFSLTEPAKNIQYSFDTDLQITVKE
jgi:transcription initiation factor IIF auxiliary subunit